MSVSEVVEALTSWGYSVSPEQITRPAPEFVLEVYAACLGQVCSITTDALQAPLQNALANIDSPDMYSQALSHNFLLIHMQKLAAAAQIKNFSAKDISFPEPERTRSILSAFINFVKFSEQCANTVLGLQNKSAAVAEERDKVVVELANAQREVENINAERTAFEPQCEALEKENNAITAYLISCRERQGVLQEEVRNLKQEKAALIQKKETLQAEAEQFNDGISRVRSRIVQSPERIRRNIITMGSTASEDKKTLNMHEAKIRDLQTRMAVLQNIEKDVRSCIEQLQTIEKEVSLLEVSKKTLADFRDQLSEKKGEVSELLLKRERVNKQLSNAQEKLERAQRHAEDRRIASQQTVERLQREYEEMAVERRDNDRQVEEMRAEADDVERKMAEHMKKSQAELNELLTEYWKLRHETEVYMETLANKLGMQVTST
ncbi:Nuf2 family-domain-containing protein [Abortiporus biennis]|nr:Nuf2 family-domain-containing protein [Abortiporus biennis]